MMKKYLQYFAILLLLYATTSCQKEDIDFLKITRQWKVIKWKKQGELLFTKPPKDYLLEFKTDTAYTLKIDVNICYGSYELSGQNNIKLSDMLCTYVCCDTDEALELVGLLPKMNTYYGKGDNLVLSGEGKIYLEPLK